MLGGHPPLFLREGDRGGELSFYDFINAQIIYASIRVSCQCKVLI